MSNNAAAVIGTPVAMSIANGLGLPAEAFVLAVLFGANMSYATPMAYKTNLLVMNAGGYTFGDFVRIAQTVAADRDHVAEPELAAAAPVWILKHGSLHIRR